MRTVKFIALAGLAIGYFADRREIMAIPLFVLFVCEFVTEQARLKEASKAKKPKN